MFIVGERINATRKRIGEAVLAKDAQFIQQEALKQVQAGACMLDVNGGVGARDAEFLPWLVNVVQEVTDVPLCLDSPNHEALKRALPLCKKTPMINSISGEADRYEQVLPLVKEYKTKIIALCMASSGAPKGVKDRLETATRLVEGLGEIGIPIENIHVDPGVFPISVGAEQPKAYLDTLAAVKDRYPDVHLIGGISNVSFGLPVRKLLNSTFMALAIGRGLDSAIMDPTDQQMMASICAAEALLGKDEFCTGYLKAFRAGKLEPKPEAKT
jgi:5-methyltetrahydrofolate--homocysteine methyltransferase